MLLSEALEITLNLARRDTDGAEELHRQEALSIVQDLLNVHSSSLDDEFAFYRIMPGGGD